MACALVVVFAAAGAAAFAQQVGDTTSAATPATQEAAAPADPLVSTDTAQGRPSVPRMLGDQLLRLNSVNFAYATVVSGPNIYISPGVAGGFFFDLRDTKVASNNSAMPTDNFSYDFSLFNQGNVVRGVSGQLAPSGLPAGYPPAKFLTQAVPRDIGLHTFTFEKAFADGLFSLEARLPFAYGLNSRLDLNAGRIFGDQQDPNNVYPDNYYLAVDPTPQNTWGSAAWELQDISLILKVNLYEDISHNLCFSGGLQVVAPTAENMHAQITDYWSGFNEFGVSGPPAFPLLNFSFDALGRRTRTLDVSNSIWTLSPFIALSMTPTPRTFFNGFLQLDVPLGTNRVNFSQSYASLLNETTGEVTYYHVQPITSFNGTPIPGDFSGSLRNQVLAQLDLGLGYWLYKDPSAQWVKGVAPILEMHVTQTLQSGQVLQLPQPSPFYHFVGTPGDQFTVGATAASTTLTDLTFGINTEIGQASTLAVGATMPLGGGTNRSFDSEVLIRFNHSF